MRGLGNFLGMISSFSSGNSLCKKFLIPKPQKNDSRKLVIDVFSRGRILLFHPRHLPPPPQRKNNNEIITTKIKIMVRLLAHILHQVFCCFLCNSIFGEVKSNLRHSLRNLEFTKTLPVSPPPAKSNLARDVSPPLRRYFRTQSSDVNNIAGDARCLSLSSSSPFDQNVL